MNYESIYERLVKRGQERPAFEGYKERHHIIPRCMGGSDEENNLVDLTPEEHFVAHQLLVKIHPDNINLWRAVKLMTSGNTKQGRSKNKMYGWLKREKFFKDNRIEVVCKLCSKSFRAYASSKRVYCGTSCRKKLGQLRKKQIGKKEHTCKVCSKIFLEFECCKRKFCSQACKSASQKTGVPIICQGCHKSFNIMPSQLVRRKYCSAKCRFSI